MDRINRTILFLTMSITYSLLLTSRLPLIQVRIAIYYVFLRQEISIITEKMVRILIRSISNDYFTLAEISLLSKL
jgi:hypothetical protein